MPKTSRPRDTLTVTTDRFGPFVLTPGLDHARVAPVIQRVDDAHQRFISSPLSQIANELEQEIVVSSIFGTNTIEGGTLSEDETRNVLALNANSLREEEQRRIANLKVAYEFAIQSASDHTWRLDTAFMRKVHALITSGLADPLNRPGEYRSNTKSLITWVGDAAHGGRYQPPQYHADIERLM